MFAKAAPAPAVIPKEPEDVKREWAIKGLKRELKDEKRFTPTNLDRHQAVLQFMNQLSSRQPGETRKELSISVARSFGKGPQFGRKIRSWEREWIENRYIPETRRGNHAKTMSWMNDEGVQLEVQKQMATMKEGQSHELVFKYR